MIVTYFQTFRRTSFSELKKEVIEGGFQWAKNTIPMVAAELQKEEDKMEIDLEAVRNTRGANANDNEDRSHARSEATS